MVAVKKHQNTSNRQEMKHRRRKPNIPELVYKFLANEAFDDTEHRFVNKCHYCDREKYHETIDSPIIGKNINYTARQERCKDSDKISKLYNTKQCSTSKDLQISHLQKCIDGEGTRKAKKYIKKALDFGVESGYLIPSDSKYRILRVSSVLMKNNSRRSKINTCDMILSKNRDTPIRLENLQEQQEKKRGRRDRRLRSGLRTHRRSRSRRKKRSRSRSRRRRRNNSPQNSEEIAEDEADNYEIDENDLKSNIHTDNTELKTGRSN